MLGKLNIPDRFRTCSKERQEIINDVLEKIKEIQNGSGVNRDFPEVPKGSMAEDLWDNSTFTYGMEYGAILILMQIFKLTKEDLK